MTSNRAIEIDKGGYEILMICVNVVDAEARAAAAAEAAEAAEAIEAAEDSAAGDKEPQQPDDE